MKNDEKRPTYCCKSYTAASLEEFLETIDFLNACFSKPDNSLLRLWYRGHAHQHYKLIPSLLRNSKASGMEYGKDHLREDYRYQHFRSKCTQLVRTFPEAKIEWLELMQHHFAQTRLMDWSESGISALLFALESFINPGRDRELNYQRMTVTPTVWILDPVKLNGHVYDAFLEKPALIQRACEGLLSPGVPDSLFMDTLDRMKTGKGRFFTDDNDKAVNGIVCLSVIESECQANASRLLPLLRSGEFNPYFYMLHRYFGDGLPVPMMELPPLAIVHPYHSPRIQAQHGVFTVMPHYIMDIEDANGVLDRRAMEYQPKISDCLYKIRITRPAKVASELLRLGERRAGLYPELEVFAKDIEATRYML